MFFKSPLIFAVVGAITASLMVFLGGAIVLGVYRGLVHYAFVPLVTHIDGFTLGVLVLAVFAIMLPIEAMYARRSLFSKDARSEAKSSFLLIPVAIAVIVCSRIIDWRRGFE